MGLFDRVRGLFGSNQPATSGGMVFAAGSGSSLLSEQAVGMLAGQLFELSDPDEVLRKAGKTRRDLRTLEADDEISGHLETRQAACMAAPWRLSDSESKVGAFSWELLDEFFEPLVEAAWQAVPYGYSVAEIIWRRDGSRRVPDRISEKPFEWFTPTREGLKYHSGIAGSGAGEIVDTTAKFMLTVRRPTYRNPRGEALLSRLYWPWFFRSNGWRFWAKFLERHGSPLLVGYSKSDKVGMAHALEQAIQSAVLAVGPEDKVEAIKPENVGQAFDLFSTAVDRRIAKLILGQTLTSGTGPNGGGSYALGRVHEAVKKDRRDADLRMVRKTLQWFVDAAVALNFPGAPVPRVSFETDSDLGTERAERDSKLVQAGAIELTEAYFLRAYDFEQGEFRVPAPVNAGRVQAAGVPLAQFASRERFTPAQQRVEALGDAAIEEAGDPLSAEAIGKAIKASADPAELVERLAALLGPDQMRPEFAQAIERAIFAADVMGYAHAAAEAGVDGSAEAGGNG